jgi:hypothetical protein
VKHKSKIWKNIFSQCATGFASAWSNNGTSKNRAKFYEWREALAKPVAPVHFDLKDHETKIHKITECGRVSPESSRKEPS